METNERYIRALAEELTVTLTRRRMTRKELGQAVGLHHNTIGRYLSGERDIPFSVMVDLCRVLGVNIADIDATARAAIGE